jgi:hypothetical protein
MRLIPTATLGSSDNLTLRVEYEAVNDGVQAKAS